MGGGFGLMVKMTVANGSIAQAELEPLARDCPYSHATRGNVQVDFEIIGSR